MKILFVCRHNRFRSKVAEAYFKKTNKNKNIKAESAGIFKGDPKIKNVPGIAGRLGIKIKKETRGLKEEYLKKFDLIVIVADDVPKTIFNKAKKVIIWKIPDTSSLNNRNEIERIMKMIFKKVDKLIKKLEEK